MSQGQWVRLIDPGSIFFFISTGIVSNNMTCEIEPNLQNKLFDHRACILGFVNTGRVKFAAKRVDNKILCHDITDYIVYGACAEAYCIHADNASLPIPEQRIILRHIGN
jgi:hypothetical protein